MTTPRLPLCDAGRCSQLLAGLAEARGRMVAAHGDRIVDVLTAVFDEVELSVEQRAKAVEVLARYVAERGGVSV